MHGSIILVCAALIGLSAGADGDLLGYLLSRYFGLRAFGSLGGVAYGAYILAATIFPLLAGVIVDRTASYKLIFVILGAMSTVSAGLLLTLGPFPPQVPLGALHDAALGERS